MNARALLTRAKGAVTASRVLRLLLLCVMLLGIVQWQRVFLEPTAKVDSSYTVTASTGINREQKFFFFLYHLHLFPIATDAPIRADTADEAKRLMREQPQLLRQDEGSTFREGDRGRTYLYFVDAWIHKNAITPSLKPAHCIAFTVALCALMVSFFYIRRPGAGLLLVALAGSSPFQLYTVYKQENVFSWAFTTLILALAVNVPLLERRKELRYYPWVAAALSGFLVAFVRTFRSEPTVVLFGAVLIYVTATWLSKRTRLGLVLVMVAAFTITSRASTAYTDGKLEQSKAAVATVGGSPYTGPVRHFHAFWHAIFCGLGDFDDKYGYVWDDRAGYRAAYPELQRRNPDLQLDPSQWMTGRTYDAAGKYPIFYGETPYYSEIIEDIILDNIRKDPAWFAGIIKKRIGKVMTTPVPVGFATTTDQYYLSGPLLTFACIPLLVFLVVSRRWAYLKLFLFALPLSIAPVAVFSGLGMTNYSCFHLFGAFLWALVAWEGMVAMWKRRRILRPGLH
jgi:hypothetical protein